jgi:hypothetical protein
MSNNTFEYYITIFNNIEENIEQKYIDLNKYLQPFNDMIEGEFYSENYEGEKYTDVIFNFDILQNEVNRTGSKLENYTILFENTVRELLSKYKLSDIDNDILRQILRINKINYSYDADDFSGMDEEWVYETMYEIESYIN